MTHMKGPTKQQILNYARSIREQASNANIYFNQPSGWSFYAQANAGAKNLLKILGEHGNHFVPLFEDVNSEDMKGIMTLVGAVSAIIDAIESDMLVTVEGLIVAEVHADLLEQAEYLDQEGYYLAAGVLGRAVLEEHVRKLCQRHGKMPQKPRPTLSDYNMALYNAQLLNKMDMKQVDALATIGNEAAHNTGKASQGDVDRLVREVREFVTRHPIN